MRARNAVAGVVILAAGWAVAPEALLAQTGQSGTRRVNAENRLFIRFVEDAAIVPSYWLEGQARYQGNLAAFDPNVSGAGESDLLSAGGVFAFNVAEDFEFGARLAVARREADNNGSDTGLTDLDLWGKVSVVSDPVKISLGILLVAPTGDEDKFLGSGETNVEFFGGIRKDLTHVSLAANAGFRINQDPDIEDLSGVEGKNSILLGGALLFPATQNLVLTAEYALETERFEGLKNDSRLLGGFEYRDGEDLMWRGAIGGGLSDGAPDFELLASVVWLF